MTDPWGDDEALLRELRDALAEPAGVPRDFVGAGQALIAWRPEDDAALADLVRDSADEVDAAGVERELLAVRSGGVRRTLSLRAAELLLEVEVERAPDAVRGQFVAESDTAVLPRQVVVELVGGGGATAEVDEFGWFSLDLRLRSRFRLRFATGSGSGSGSSVSSVVSPWVNP